MTDYKKFVENSRKWLVKYIEDNHLRSIINGDKILEEWKFLVVERPKGSISSTEIRKLIRECKDISPYVYNRAKDRIRRYYFYKV